MRPPCERARLRPVASARYGCGRKSPAHRFRSRPSATAPFHAKGPSLPECRFARPAGAMLASRDTPAPRPFRASEACLARRSQPRESGAARRVAHANTRGPPGVGSYARGQSAGGGWAVRRARSHRGDRRPLLRQVAAALRRGGTPGDRVTAVSRMALDLFKRRSPALGPEP
jgi:hypothetical protein